MFLTHMQHNEKVIIVFPFYQFLYLVIQQVSLTLQNQLLYYTFLVYYFNNYIL